MPSRRRDVHIDTHVNDAGSRKKMKALGDEALKSSKSFSTLAKVGIAGLVGSQLVSFFKDSAQAALEDEASQRQLALALRNTVDATDEQVASTEDFIDRTARASGVADDQLRPALAELVRTTGDLETAQDTLGVAMDIAAAKSIPLETVTKAIGKAALGNVGALGRLGVATKDTEGKTMTFEQVLDEAARTMGGATAEAADTAGGKMRRLNVAIGESKETIGNALLPILEDGADALLSMDTVLGFVADKFENMPAPISEVGGSVTDLLGPFGLIKEAWGLAEEQVIKLQEAETGAITETDNLNVSMDKARHPARKMVDVQEDLAAASQEVAAAIREIVDEQRAAASPAFAALKAARDLDSAQEDYNQALLNHGAASDEAIDAASRMAEAQLEAEAAAEVFAEQGGAESVQALKDMLREGGAMPATIQAIIDAILKYNQTPMLAKPVLTGKGGKVTFVPVGGKYVPEFDTGGVVPGPKGSEQLIKAHGGETILPTHKGPVSMGGRPGTLVNVTVVDPSARTLRELMELARRGAR